MLRHEIADVETHSGVPSDELRFIRAGNSEPKPNRAGRERGVSVVRRGHLEPKAELRLVELDRPIEVAHEDVDVRNLRDAPYMPKNGVCLKVV